MIGLDCNILVQLAFADHPAHVKTVAAVQNETQAGAKLVFPSLVINEFLHVSTDDKRFTPPLSMSDAIDWVEELLKNPTVNLVEPNQAAMDQTIRWMRQFRLGRKRILDTHLAAILHTNGVDRLLTANPADFTIFGVLKIITI
jgi:Predicted nucleic acid-binding protein, contains PIN domain